MFKCLICRKEYKNLEAHIRRLHKISREEYSKRFNYTGQFMISMSKESREKVSNSKKGKTPWNKGLTKDDARVAKTIETRRNNGNYVVSTEQREKISNTLREKISFQENWKHCDVINNRDKLVEWCNSFNLKMNRKPTYTDLSKYINCSYHTAERIIKRNDIRNLFKVSGFSRFEMSVEDFIKTLNVKYIKHDRTQIKPQELDFYFPEARVAIEVNDIATHNVTKNTAGYCDDNSKYDKLYHYHKSKKCEENNIRLIHIWEYEWFNKRQRPILENIIKNALGINNQKIYARKCKIIIKKSREMREFFDRNNIQGFRGRSICYLFRV